MPNQREAARLQPQQSVTSVTVNRPVEELYAFWRDFTNYPRIMDGLEAIVLHNGHMHWKAKVLGNAEAEWIVTLVEDRPNEWIAWPSVEDTTVKNAGAIHFAPAPAERGTEVTLTLEFDPPGGAIGNAVAKFLGAIPDMFAYKAMHRFKCLMETGEIPTTAYQPAARNDGRGE